MPRQCIHHTRETHGFPDDFPERLVRFKEESKLPWAEISRRLGTHPETVATMQRPTPASSASADACGADWLRPIPPHKHREEP